MDAPFTRLRRWQWAALCMFIAVHLAGATVTATAACRTADEHTNPLPTPRELVVLDHKGDDRQLYSTSVALLVGESKYLGGANGFTPLTSVRREMATLRKVLEAHGFEVYVYYDLDSSNLKSTLECFFTSQLPGDTEMRFFMYISAHGMTLKSPNGTKDGYILPVDIKRPNGQDPQDDVVRSTGLRLSQFAEWAANAVMAKHALFVFDSCFSGAVLNPVMKGPDKSEKPRPPGYALTDEAQRPLREFLAAGTEDQEVPASSYFLDVIDKALLGERREADSNHDGILTGTELITFVRETVSEQNSQQTPTAGRLNVHDMNRGEMAFVLPPLQSQKIGITPPAQVASSAGKFKPVYRGVIDPGKGGAPQLVQFFQSEQYLTTDGAPCTTDCSKPGEARTYKLTLDIPSDAPTNSTFDAPELSCIAGPCGQGFRLLSGPTLDSNRRHASVAFQSPAKQAIWRFSARVLTDASAGAAVVVDRRDGSVQHVSDRSIAVSGTTQDVSPDYEQKLKPLLSDLQSDDQQYRHAGRKTLAYVLSHAPPSVIAQLVRAMPVSTYRYQLGVAEALGRIEPGWRTTEASSTALLNSLRDKKNQDPTLKSSINKALLNQQYYVTDESIRKDALNAANTASTPGGTEQTIVKAGSDVELKAGAGDASGIVSVAKKGSCLRLVNSKQYTASDGSVAVVRHPKC